MNFDYLYVSPKHLSGKNWAIIVLPEIFGIHPFIKQVTDNLASEHQVLALALDHLYAGTGKIELYDYETGHEQAFTAMNAVTGEKFLDLFTQTINQVRKLHPEIEHFVSLGFCFGGRLALLSGVHGGVSKIVSFYGGGPHAEFYRGKGSVEALANARAESDLDILAFYGEQDQMIPATDRVKTKDLLSKAHINYTEHIYNCGHAFANCQSIAPSLLLNKFCKLYLVFSLDLIIKNDLYEKSFQFKIF